MSAILQNPSQTAIGIDVGTSAVKVIAVAADGEVLVRREVPYPLSTPKPGWSEQNPDDWWRATEQALEGLTDGVAGIGLSGQMHGLVTLDARDQPIRPAILWNDQRTGEQCAQIEAEVGFSRLVELTGNRALTGFTAPKLLWLREHEPDHYARIAHVMLPKDYVRLKLTGERAIDVADASGTLLLDVAQRRWSDEVLAALEIDPAWLDGVTSVGVTSGASVPEVLVRDVLAWLTDAGYADVVEIETAREDLMFSLPKELRVEGDARSLGGRQR